MPRILILEDSQRVGNLFRAQLEGDKVEVVIAETAADARVLFSIENFDVIALDAIAPSGPGATPSLVGPVLAREFRGKGYTGPLVAISSDLKARELTKRAAEGPVQHLTYACEKLKLAGLIRELLGIYSVPPK